MFGKTFKISLAVLGAVLFTACSSPTPSGDTSVTLQPNLPTYQLDNAALTCGTILDAKGEQHTTKLVITVDDSLEGAGKAYDSAMCIIGQLGFQDDTLEGDAFLSGTHRYQSGNETLNIDSKVIGSNGYSSADMRHRITFTFTEGDTMPTTQRS